MSVNSVHTILPEWSNVVKNSTFLLYMAAETEQLNSTAQSYAWSNEFNRNIFLKTLFNMHSRLLICDLFSGQCLYVFVMCILNKGQSTFWLTAKTIFWVALNLSSRDYTTSHPSDHINNVRVVAMVSKTRRSWKNPGDWKRETWHCETGQCGTISQGRTSRDLFQCSSRCSLQVYVWCREYYTSCSSVLCFQFYFFLFYLLLRAAD